MSTSMTSSKAPFNPMGILVNWNSAVDCIRVVGEYSGTWQFVVVDNNSPDLWMLEEFEQTNGNVHLISKNTNLGYADGVNTGLMWGYENGFSHALILNPDTEHTADLLEYLESKHDQIDLLAIQQVHRNRHDQLEFYPCSATIVRGNYVPYIPYNRGLHDVPVVTGACLFVDILTAKKVGYFDTSFFHYKEEFQFAHDITEMGGRVVLSNDLVISHRGGGSLDTKSGHAQYYYARNEIRFAIERLHKSKAYVCRLAVYLLLTRTATAGLSKLPVILLGLCHGFRGVGGKLQE
jgi:GT2 family glycosyltransferase